MSQERPSQTGASPATTGGTMPPGGLAGVHLCADGVPQEALWSALVSEPETGVGIITVEGQVLFLNLQAARIFHGPDAKPADYLGKFWRDLHPPEWVDERLTLLQRVLVSGRPLMMRTIWRGYQQHTWIHHIEADEPEAMEDGEPSQPMPDRFLTITRRVGSDDEKEELTSSKYEFVESQVADLGPLESLTPRELEVLALIGQGLTLKEVAQVLHRSFKTIDNHRQSIGTKLKVEDRVQLAEVARRAGLTLRDAERVRV